MVLPKHNQDPDQESESLDQNSRGEFVHIKSTVLKFRSWFPLQCHYWMIYTSRGRERDKWSDVI